MITVGSPTGEIFSACKTMTVHENTQAGFAGSQILQDKHERLDASYIRAAVTERVPSEEED